MEGTELATGGNRGLEKKGKRKSHVVRAWGTGHVSGIGGMTKNAGTARGVGGECDIKEGAEKQQWGHDPQQIHGDGGRRGR